jgi:hypothetical protein
LKDCKQISKERCIKALQTMANSDFQFSLDLQKEIPEEVDMPTFCKLCEKALGPFAKKEF